MDHRILERFSKYGRNSDGTTLKVYASDGTHVLYVVVWIFFSLFFLYGVFTFSLYQGCTRSFGF